MLEKLTKDIEAATEVFESMPLDTLKNKEKVFNDVSLEISKYEGILKNIYLEFKNRLSCYDSLVFDDFGSLYSDVSKFYDDLLYTTDMNTPYEKLGFDRVIYDLSCYEDMPDSFNYLNKKIDECVSIFDRVSVCISASSFRYSSYVNQYMTKFFVFREDLSCDELKSSFDSIFWQCPNLVMHIILNFKSLYLKNIGSFNRYIKNYNRSLLSNFSSKQGLIDGYSNARRKYDLARVSSKNNLLYNFYNDVFNPDDYTDEKIGAIISNLFNGSLDEKALNKLLNSLYEFKEYQSYVSLIDKIRELYKEDLEKDFLGKRFKQIGKLESKLFALNKKSSRRLSLTKVDKYEPIINDLIDQIKVVYDEIDSSIMKVKIKECLKDNSTIFKALLLMAQNYGILASYFKSSSDYSYNEISSLLDSLALFVLDPDNTVISNLTILDDVDVASIIVSNYRLFNVNIEKESLLSSLDSIISDLEKLRVSRFLSKYGVSICDLQSVKKSKLIVSNYEK